MRSIRTTLIAGIATLALVAGGSVPAASALSRPAAPPLPATAATAIPPSPLVTDYRMPLSSKTYTVSSYFGPRCIPLPGASTYHMGVDLAARGGSPIYAIAAGVVTHTVTGTSSRVGYISVRHNIGGAEYTSMYLHIWSATTHVKVGQVVKAGQRISEVGTSGGSSGNHLHLEVWKAAPGGAQAQNPVTFLKAHGVDLYASATAINAKATPASCTYYTTGSVNFRTGPSTAYSAMRLLPIATAMVHVPGRITSGFIPVKVGTQTGWVSSSYVSPNKPAVPAPAVVVKPVPTPPPATKPPVTTPPVTKPPAPAPAPATYVTTAPLNLRAAPSTTAKRLLLIPKGANVGVVKATQGVWKKVTYKGKTGWVHSAYLKKR